MPIVTSLYSRSDGGLWIGLDVGVACFDGETLFELPVPDWTAATTFTVRSLLETSGGDLIVASTSGAIRDFEHTGTWELLSPDIMGVFSLHEDNYGRLRSHRLHPQRCPL